MRRNQINGGIKRGGHVRFGGLDEFVVAKEEEEESSLPKARNAGVLRHTLALAVAGGGEPEPTACPRVATFPRRHREGRRSQREREGGENREK
jgi:hypothetical protein